MVLRFDFRLPRVSAAIYEAAKEGALKDKFTKMAAEEYAAVGVTFPRLDAEEIAWSPAQTPGVRHSSQPRLPVLRSSRARSARGR